MRKVSRSLSFNRGRSESAAVDEEVAALRQDEVVALLDYLRKGGSQLALKSGYVEKQAVDSRKVDRRWKKRWFELHAHVIVWYKEPNTAPKGYMMLTAANTVGQTIVGKGQAIVLASSTTSRSLQFRAAYAPEHRAWLEAIGGALEVLRSALPPGAEESRQTVKARAEARVKYGTERGGAPAAAPPVLKMHSAYGDTDTDTMSVSGSERSHGSAGRDRADSRNYWEGETAEASPAYPRRTRKPSYSVPPTTLAPGVWKPAPPPPPTGSPPGRASVTAPPPPPARMTTTTRAAATATRRRPRSAAEHRLAVATSVAAAAGAGGTAVVVRASFPEPPAQAARGGAAAPRASPAAGRTGDFPPPPARAGSSGAGWRVGGGAARGGGRRPMAWKARVR